MDLDVNNWIWCLLVGLGRSILIAHSVEFPWWLTRRSSFKNWYQWSVTGGFHHYVFKWDSLPIEHVAWKRATRDLNMRPSVKVAWKVKALTRGQLLIIPGCRVNFHFPIKWFHFSSGWMEVRRQKQKHSQRPKRSAAPWLHHGSKMLCGAL